MNLFLQSLFPQCLLSRLVGKLADKRFGFLTRFFIQAFIRRYKVNLDEAAISDFRSFHTFNEFFTRLLKPEVRSIPEGDAIISPVDGCVSECGYAAKDQILQAKGAYFSINQLLVGDAAAFDNGAFLTAYLSPKDYHHFHMPIAGTLVKMIYVPGKLFSVNPYTVNALPGLFSKNERVICIFETALGKMVMVAVGAMIVGSVAIEGHGVIAPGKKITDFDVSMTFARGDRLGHFRLGSTIILLFEKYKIQWSPEIQKERVLKLYEPCATVRSPAR
ncbi:MAG: phosphatidylserine decarboxylase [Gammaproteobacteria bacterium RIFCSPHIGHO2_12_FULL_42_13]|nr:MAG: phosphatidylserine decarboxylase [Gammaproteobacteria bacterium RIFCSPHIGHO2_12_FULL_42_13]